MRSISVLSCLALILLSGVAAAQKVATRPSAGPSCAGATWKDVIASISANGELLLASGGTIKLLDVRLPSEDEEREGSRAWLRSLGGRPVAVAALDGAEDRWNRIAADLTLLSEEAPIDLAGQLIDAGLAVVDAGDRRTLCRPELLGREERARTQGKGIWASGRHAPVAAGDLERLQEHVGRFAIVEGVVRSVGERRERTFLNFGADWANDLTVTIPKRTWATMAERGLSAETLKGRRVRVRGVLEEWQGVAVEITAADMLEVLGQDTARP